MKTIRIDRAPVLTLWASIVAERLGWPHDTALTMGRAIAGTTAHSNRVRLDTHAQPEDRRHEPAPSPPAEVTGAIRDVPLLGRIVHVAPTAEGPRAISKDAVVKPDAVERYLRGKFGDQLCAVLSAMERLAAAMSKDTLDDEAFHLYEHFRPEVPSGKPGQNAKGILDLALIHALVRTKRQEEWQRPRHQHANPEIEANERPSVTGSEHSMSWTYRNGAGISEYYARLKREERVEVKLSGHSAR